MGSLCSCTSWASAAPGAAFVRYGGHTSCVAVTHQDASDPTLVPDAGTDLRTLTDCLEGRAYDGAKLLRRLHWNHVQGLPFVAGGDRDDARVDLYVPAQTGARSVGTKHARRGALLVG